MPMARCCCSGLLNGVLFSLGFILQVGFYNEMRHFQMYTPVRNSKGANRDQIVHDRVFFLCPCRQWLSTVCLKSYIPKCMHVLYKKLTTSVSFKRLKIKCNAETFNDRQRKKE